MKNVESVMQVMRAHGLMCVALTESGLIGLQDVKGNIYDVVVWQDNKLHDAEESYSLYAWLGY